MTKDMPIVVINVAIGMDFFFLRGSSATLSMVSASKPESAMAISIDGTSPNFKDVKKAVDNGSQQRLHRRYCANRLIAGKRSSFPESPDNLPFNPNSEEDRSSPEPRI